mmetsp:Transcript_5911/g.16045  ORF Transcript_5911/g.16045 Transcript_5911/m.16045 type:complete len:389 (+) Transcript_5911:877-2043(+)
MTAQEPTSVLLDHLHDAQEQRGLGETIASGCLVLGHMLPDERHHTLRTDGGLVRRAASQQHIPRRRVVHDSFLRPLPVLVTSPFIFGSSMRCQEPFQLLLLQFAIDIVRQNLRADPERRQRVLTFDMRPEMNARAQSHLLGRRRQKQRKQGSQCRIVQTKVHAARANRHGVHHEILALRQDGAREFMQRHADGVHDADAAFELYADVILEGLHHDVPDGTHLARDGAVGVVVEFVRLEVDQAVHAIAHRRKDLGAAVGQGLAIIRAEIRPVQRSAQLVHTKQLALQLKVLDVLLHGLGHVHHLASQEHQPEVGILHVPRRQKPRLPMRFCLLLLAALPQMCIEFGQFGLAHLRRLLEVVGHAVNLLVDRLAFIQTQILHLTRQQLLAA